MDFEKTPIKDLLIIKPKVFKDTRGYFFEAYNRNIFVENNITDSFVQDNQSLSSKGVLRGLHFQNPPFAQAKLIRVIKGSVLDVAVDIRKNSPTFGKYYSIELNETNQFMFYIPIGFAHGFLTLEDDTIFSYKCSNVYNKESEGVIKWDDPTLNIQWKINNPILSERDKTASLFSNFATNFI